MDLVIAILYVFAILLCLVCFIMIIKLLKIAKAFYQCREIIDLIDEHTKALNSFCEVQKN